MVKSQFCFYTHTSVKFLNLTIYVVSEELQFISVPRDGG